MSKQRYFISYANNGPDRKWIRAFAEALQRRGARVWLDELAVRAGESLREATEDAFRQSDVFVPVLNADTLTRPNFFFEWGAAVGMGKPMIPIVPPDLDPAVLPLPVRSRKWLLQRAPDQTALELVSLTMPEAAAAN